MKATLEFSLPEERQDLDIALKAPDVYRTLTDIQAQIRMWNKHGLPAGVCFDDGKGDQDPQVGAAIQHIYSYVCEEISRLGIEE